MIPADLGNTALHGEALDPNSAMGNVTWISLVVAFGALDVFPVLEMCTSNQSEPSCICRDPDTVVQNFALARIEFLIHTLLKICL
jgi:hypothetical protein